MYKVDGVDLSTTEFQVLEELVAKSRGEEGLPQPNREMFPVYERLVNLGLLHGRAVAGGFAGLAVSPRGFDVVDDWYEMERRRLANEKDERDLRIFLTVLSASIGLVGTLAGVLIGKFL